MSWKHYETSERFARRSTVPLPSIVDTDVLAGMPDEELAARFRSLDEDRGRAIESGRVDPTSWEVELAYVRREQQIRRTRRMRHVDFMKKADEDFRRQDVGLPSGDFDNFSFVFAASGGWPR